MMGKCLSKNKKKPSVAPDDWSKDPKKDGESDEEDEEEVQKPKPKSVEKIEPKKSALKKSETISLSPTPTPSKTEKIENSPNQSKTDLISPSIQDLNKNETKSQTSLQKSESKTKNKEKIPEKKGKNSEKKEKIEKISQIPQPIPIPLQHQQHHHENLKKIKHKQIKAHKDKHKDHPVYNKKKRLAGSDESHDMEFLSDQDIRKLFEDEENKESKKRMRIGSKVRVRNMSKSAKMSHPTLTRTLFKRSKSNNPPSVTSNNSKKSTLNQNPPSVTSNNSKKSTLNQNPPSVTSNNSIKPPSATKTNAKSINSNKSNKTTLLSKKETKEKKSEKQSSSDDDDTEDEPKIKRKSASKKYLGLREWFGKNTFHGSGFNDRLQTLTYGKEVKGRIEFEMKGSCKSCDREDCENKEAQI